MPSTRLEALAGVRDHGVLDFVAGSYVVVRGIL